MYFSIIIQKLTPHFDLKIDPLLILGAPANYSQMLLTLKYLRSSGMIEKDGLLFRFVPFFGLRLIEKYINSRHHKQKKEEAFTITMNVLRFGFVYNMAGHSLVVSHY